MLSNRICLHVHMKYARLCVCVYVKNFWSHTSKNKLVFLLSLISIYISENVVYMKPKLHLFIVYQVSKPPYSFCEVWLDIDIFSLCLLFSKMFWNQPWNRLLNIESFCPLSWFITVSFSENLFKCHVRNTVS